MKSVSVVIPVLNGEKTIKACVTSILNQNYPRNRFEIIVVDNGSTDKTSQELKKVREEIIFLNEGKKSSYAARNKGIAHAKGSIVAFIDADCVADKNWLRNLIRGFKNKQVKVVGGAINSFSNSSPLSNYCDLFCHQQYRSSKLKNPYFATANVAIRTILLRTYLFNDTLQSGGDVELCNRIIKERKELCYVPEAKVTHQYSSSLLTLMKKYYLYGKGQSILQTKYGINSNLTMPTYLSVLRKYGVLYSFFRLLNDIAYKSGFILRL